MGLYCTCPYGSTAELSKDVMSNLQWHFINPYWYHQLNHSQALTDEQKFTKNLRITPPETDLSILQLVGKRRIPPKPWQLGFLLHHLVNVPYILMQFLLESSWQHFSVIHPLLYLNDI